MTTTSTAATVHDMTSHLPEGKPKGEGEEKGPSQSTVLLQMGQEGYRYVHDGVHVYAVEIDGPAIARPLKGTGGLRQALTRRYAVKTGKAPSQGSLTDAVSTLEALADVTDPVELSLRVGADADSPHATWLDLGRADGQSVCIDPTGWALASPPDGRGPLWRRTRRVGTMPMPERHADGWEAGLSLLRGVLPVSDAAWPMTVAWLLSALRPDIPRPIAYFTGEQGTGKSTAGRLLLRVIDGIGADLCAPPRTEDDLAVATAAGWVLAMDNLSSVAPWLSDALCRTVTGDSIMKRELYSNDDVTLLIFRRPVLLTGIDIGAVRGDLAERMLPLQLEVIPDTERRAERDLWGEYRRSHPHILGGLLTLAAQVWERLPEASQQLKSRPRMADWAELLWALDDVTGWDTLGKYTGAQDELIDDVLSSDRVGSTLLAWATSSVTPDQWEGEVAQLLEILPAPLGDQHWPRTPGALSGRLTRAAPSLRKRGVDVARKRVKGRRVVTITVDRTATR